ncbi:formylglycine-generating enzyme family protein [Desulfococcaceae bacterium HSG8]|nr:formylglycine-generating enzyme family protein [Desulfococcaceae bacterium HSG8]
MEVSECEKQESGIQPDQDETEIRKSPETDLHFFEGIWESKRNKSTFCSRLVNQRLFVPYCYGGNHSLTAHLYDSILENNRLYVRFKWFSEPVSGSGVFRIKSENRIVGELYLIPSPFGMQFHTSGIGGDRTEITLIRKTKSTQFPRWAEEYFEKTVSHPENISQTDTSPSQMKDSEPEFTEPITGMQFVFIPGGTFLMGDTFGMGSDNEYPVHIVQLDGFYLGKYPVTQGQWKRIMNKNPSKFMKGDDYPVETVSWRDTQEFIVQLTTMNNGKYQFRLPSEAEWEYVARSGGEKEKFAGNNNADTVAWYKENSDGSTHPVGMKAQNGLGIYDMSGNTWEWCQDNYDFKAYTLHQPKNPVYTDAGSSRVSRGGSWNIRGLYVRCTARNYSQSNYTNSDQGFRLVGII